MDRVLVLGGAGLVGSHLVDRMLAEGNEVIAIDDLSRGSFASLAHLKRDRRFAFFEHDVTSPFRAQVNAVFHLAVPSTRVACAHDVVKAVLTCVTGTWHALEVAAANDARLVIATSTERWGEGVRCAESLAAEYANTRGADVRIVRLPSAYGPRIAPDGDHLVTELVRQALCRQELNPRVRLDRLLRLAYVDDAVETMVRIMASEEHTPAIVAPSCEASVAEVARLIAAAAGAPDLEVAEPSGPASTSGPASGPASVPASARSVAFGLGDALPASVALGLAPSVDLAEGIARTVRWFEERASCRAARPRRHESGLYSRSARPAPDSDARQVG